MLPSERRSIACGRGPRGAHSWGDRSFGFGVGLAEFEVVVEGSSMVRSRGKRSGS